MALSDPNVVSVWMLAKEAQAPLLVLAADYDSVTGEHLLIRRACGCSAHMTAAWPMVTTGFCWSGIGSSSKRLVDKPAGHESDRPARSFEF